MGEGGGKLSKATLPEPVYSLLFSDYFVSPVTDNLLFLNQHDSDPATVPDWLPWTPCNFMISICIFGDGIFLAFSGPTEQFCIHEELSLGQGKSNKTPLPRCVWGGWGVGVGGTVIR